MSDERALLIEFFDDQRTALIEALDGGPNATFRLEAHDTVESVIADYRAQIAASNEIIATADLDALCSRPDVADKDLRWVALHLIEETTRHAGHADIIRESL